MHLSEIASGILAGIAAGAEPQKKLSAELCRLTESPRCALLSSGRAAMTVMMSAVANARAAEGRDEVIVAGYTCYSVPASVLRAGLKVRLCDVDPSTLSLDLEALGRFNFSRVAAIVSANLYGIPNDLGALERLAAQHGVWLIDDAAQALGARVAGRPVGGFGAGGVLSFDKGKNITTIQGGAALLRDDRLASQFDKRFAEVCRTDTIATAALVTKLLVYALALRPVLYEYVQRLPLLGLGKTVYEDDFPVCRLSGTLSGVALRLLERLDDLQDTRAANAAALQSSLASCRGIRFVESLPDAVPAYARFPIFIADARAREAAIATLHASGIGATTSYPEALCDVPEVAANLQPADRKLPGSRAVARSIVTLPTHPYCPPNFGDTVARALRPLLA